MSSEPSKSRITHLSNITPTSITFDWAEPKENNEKLRGFELEWANYRAGSVGRKVVSGQLRRANITNLGRLITKYFVHL